MVSKSEIFFLTGLFCVQLDCVSVEQLQIGNLALASSQQPGPLIGFGQNILGKKDLQFFCYVSDLVGCHKNFTTIMPAVLYGIQDNLSVLVELPIAAAFEINDQSYQGVQDLLLQFEYAVFDQMKLEVTNQVTLVANVSVPTGFESGNHQQNFGSSSFQAPTFFLGTTISHVGTVWYPFASFGAQITTQADSGAKVGNQYFYQAGLGRNISAKADKYIFNLLLEFDGTFKEQNSTNGTLDVNSGGNQILLGPSCWFSTPRFIFQAGVSWVVYESLCGVQNQNSYYIALDVGYKF